jgi:hypothetical protein
MSEAYNFLIILIPFESNGKYLRRVWLYDLKMVITRVDQGDTK